MTQAKRSSAEILAAADRDAILTVVCFATATCEPCTRLARDLQNLAEEMPSVMDFMKADVGLCPDLAALHRVRTLPTLLAFRAGRLLDMRIDDPTPSEIRRWIHDLQDHRSVKI